MHVSSHTRRRFLRFGVGGLLASASCSHGTSVASDGKASTVDDHARGLLLGSLIGDALGVPIEFQPTDNLRAVMPDARNWPASERLDDERKRDLAGRLRILPTIPYRPTAEPFGVWSDQPALGSLSDDSRMKIILMRAIRAANAQKRELEPADIARQFIHFQPHTGRTTPDKIEDLIQENLSEYRMASTALLSEKAPATPGDRIWGGVDNCSGQMMFPPLSILDAGKPTSAYRRCYALNFIDTPAAKDIIASINAGLSAVLTKKVLTQPASVRWKTLIQTMRSTDPYGYADVPFVGRRLLHWLDLAESIADRSNGRPATAYRLLETEGKPVFFWDAHFTLLVPLTMLHLCNFDPLASMHLCLDFGHDTDSYAQLLGALIGAVHGPGVFPSSITAPVVERLHEDYGESIDDWTHTLSVAQGD